MALNPESPSEIEETRLKDLRPTDRPVIIVGRVLTASRREVTRKADGGRRPVLTGLLSDGTATVRFTWWDPPSGAEIDRGTVLRAGPVQVREFRGRAEVSFGWRTRVEPGTESDLPAIEPEELPARRIAELGLGDEGFRLEVRVVRVAAKSVTVGEESRQLFEGIFGDASGAVSFTAWSDFGLHAGEALRILGGYVREFRSRRQVVVDERSRIDRIAGENLPALAEFQHGQRRAIGLVEDAGGGEMLTLEGRVLGLLPPSGVVYRCPHCRRTVQNGLCRVHGAVAATPDLRSRLVLDDGTGAATVNLEREATEALFGRTLDSCLAELRERPDPSQLEEDLLGRVFGRRLAVEGRATVDDFGLNVYPETVTPIPTGTSEETVQALGRRLAGRGP